MSEARDCPEYCFQGSTVFYDAPSTDEYTPSYLEAGLLVQPQVSPPEPRPGQVADRLDPELIEPQLVLPQPPPPRRAEPGDGSTKGRASCSPGGRRWCRQCRPRVRHRGRDGRMRLVARPGPSTAR